MTEKSNEDNKIDCAYHQSVPWHHTDAIVRNLSTFLGPTNLCSFRLVCKKWKEESYSTWKYHRTRHILYRYSESGLRTSKTLHDHTFPKVDFEPLTVLSEYRPYEMECNFDCIWTEELLDFFSRAARNDFKLMDTSFLVIRLKNWNRFGSFGSGEHEGAKWLLNYIADKVVHLTLDECILSINQGDFFPAFCRMTNLKEVIIRGTYFHLHQSVPVIPTFAEITPLPNLKVVEMNYEKCTVEGMSNYCFPWEIFLRATPMLKVLIFSFSNGKGLNFAINEFTKMIIVPNLVRGKIFRNLSESKEEPIIPKTIVIEMVQESLQKLGIGSSPKNPPLSSDSKFNTLFALVQNRLIVIKFQDQEDDPALRNIGLAMDLLLDPHEIHFEN